MREEKKGFVLQFGISKVVYLYVRMYKECAIGYWEKTGGDNE